MRAAIILPARLQSTRLPRKLLRDDTGLPLVCHTAMAAARIRDASGGMFAQVILAADSEEIRDAADKFEREHRLGVGVVMTRVDHQSGSDRIAEAARALGPDIDAVLNLQGDEPEIPHAAALDLARFFMRTGPDIATLVYPITSLEDRQNPALVKVVLGRDGRALYFSRADIPHRRDGGDSAHGSLGHVGIYLYKRSSLERFVALPPGDLETTEKLEQLRALENGMTIRALVMPARPPKGIDTPEDYAEFVARVKAGR